MPKKQGSPALHEVYISLVFYVLDERTLAAFDKKRGCAHSLKRSHGRIHASDYEFTRLIKGDLVGFFHFLSFLKSCI